MSNVFRIALPGKDVKEARVWETAVDNLYPNPKIDTAPTPPHAGIINLNWTRTAAVTNNTTVLIHSFPHGYNHVPTVFASYSFSNATVTTPIKGTLPFQLGAIAIITIDADATNINLKYYSTDAGATAINPFTMQIRYYVMAEKGFE